MKKFIAVLGLAFALAACNMPFAHAATTDLIANNGTMGDGRLYPVSHAQTITQTTNGFTILYRDGTQTPIYDPTYTKFNSLAGMAEFKEHWLLVAVQSTSTPVYVNLGEFDYAVCTGNVLNVGGNGHGSLGFTDGTACQAYKALYGASY